MKAISPVIATVIIVAVAIAISIAVALWMTGLTTTFTGLEKLEIVNAYATVSGNGWQIKITVKNTGTKTVTIDNIFINNKPGTLANANTESPSGTVSRDTSTGYVSLDPGSQVTISFTLGTGSGDLIGDSFSSGQTVSIIIHTASGGQYPATVTLP